MSYYPKRDKEFTEVLFVSPNGDGGGGKNWQTAYTTVTAALAAASTNANRYTQIYVAPGTYDINTTADPSYSANVCLEGRTRHDTVIKNTHASATSVLKFTGKTSLKHLTIDCNTGTTGVIFTSTGNVVTDVYFESEDVTNTQSAIKYDGGSEYNEISSVLIHGVSTYTTGLHLAGTSIGNFTEMHINDCLIGIHCDTTDDEENHFDAIYLHGNATGVTIDSGADNNEFHNVDINGSTTNISDAGTSTFWSRTGLRLDQEKIKLIPTTISAVQVATGAAANTWGSYVDLIPANTVTTPFKIKSIVSFAMSDANAYYALGLATNDANADATSVIDTIGFRGDRTGEGLPLETGWFAPNTAVMARVQTHNGGNDTINLGIHYVETE